MLKTKFVGPYYRKGTGTIGFKYEVTGTAEEIAAYKAAKGTFYREDEKTGKPLHFAANGYEGQSRELDVTETGVFVKDNRVSIVKNLIRSTSDPIDREILMDEYKGLKSAETRELMSIMENLNKVGAAQEVEAPGANL